MLGFIFPNSLDNIVQLVHRDFKIISKWIVPLLLLDFNPHAYWVDVLV